MARERRSNEKGPGLLWEARPCEKSSCRLLATPTILMRQFGGNGGKSIETGKGGRSPSGCAPFGVLAVGAAEAPVCLTVGDIDIPAPAGAAVVVVRPSEAATDVDPMPGTVGSITLALLPEGPRGMAPEVRFTSVVVGPELAAGPPEPGPGPACERAGSTAAGV